MTPTTLISCGFGLVYIEIITLFVVKVTLLDKIVFLTIAQKQVITAHEFLCSIILYPIPYAKVFVWYSGILFWSALFYILSGLFHNQFAIGNAGVTTCTIRDDRKIFFPTFTIDEQEFVRF